MTFNEYISQVDPVRNPKVEVKLSDCFTKCDTINGLAVSLVIAGDVHCYLVGDYGVLWTLDNDGNKKKRSVFTLIEA